MKHDDTHYVLKSALIAIAVGSIPIALLEAYRYMNSPEETIQRAVLYFAVGIFVIFLSTAAAVYFINHTRKARHTTKTNEVHTAKTVVRSQQLFTEPKNKPADTVTAKNNGNKRILILGGDTRLTALYTSWLQGYGFQVFRENSNRTGVSRAIDLLPALILVDAAGQEQQQWETVRAIKLLPDIAHIPMVTMSVDKSCKTASNMGAINHISLPVSKLHLISTIEKSIEDTDAPLLVVIDANPVDSRIVSKMLTPAGFKVILAKTASEGYQLVTDNQPVAVVLDTILPDSEGLSIIHKLKTSETTGAIPLIVFSNREFSTDELAYLDEHTCAVLCKSECSQVLLTKTVKQAII